MTMILMMMMMTSMKKTMALKKALAGTNEIRLNSGLSVLETLPVSHVNMTMADISVLLQSGLFLRLPKR